MLARRLLLPALVVALAAGGCGGDEESAGSGSATESAAGSGGETVRVVMKDILFVPEKVTARVGQTVRWTNEDSVEHDVKGAGFASEPLGEGDSYEVELNKAGTIDYVCTIHPSQRGSITVVKR